MINFSTLFQKAFYLLLLFLLISPFFVKDVFAEESNINCDNRFVTLVNPVRGRELWFDKSLSPLLNQYAAVKQNNFPATWLLTYDSIVDQELVSEIKKFDSLQEKGIFLEISPKLANQARVIYPSDKPWFSPSAVFLSGYSQTERKKLIDTMFDSFKNQFGYLPVSVGAWWIDSYSLNYLKEKYQIKAAMIVADQKTTDNYGVWGQWWGVPYYPSKANILTPASSVENKQNVAVIQWAERDPLLAYGEGPAFSNYSLQANDYIRQGKNTDYFKDLISVYLDCQNTVGQITVGLETGIESVNYLDEYQNQLKAIKELSFLKPVTMGEFADYFTGIYPEYPKQIKLNYKNSVWDLTTTNRFNEALKDSIYYQPDISFSDYFLADKNLFLDRNLTKTLLQKNIPYFPFFILVELILGLFALKKGYGKLWLISCLLSLVSFGLVFKSYYQYGWAIFYGPEVPFLPFFQISLVAISFAAVFLIQKIQKKHAIPLFLWLWPLTYGLDALFLSLRATFLSGQYYFGFLVDPLKFAGITISKNFQMQFIYHDLPSYQAEALLKINLNFIWENIFLWFLIYPLLHLIAAVGIAWLVIKFKIFRKYVIGLLIILTTIYLIYLWQIDTRLISPLQ